MVKRYKKYFKENSLSVLKDEKIVDDIFDYIYNNPYPTDDDFHKFVESKNADPDDYETYVYAILSCFIAGGRAYDKKKAEKDFDEKEVAMGLKVEYEHLDEKNDNKIVKYIVDKLSGRIASDHLTENKVYYSDGKKFDFFDELK